MIVIYLYNRLFDPLIQGNFWLYIRDLLDQPLPGVRLHVVTYEDPRFPITSRQKQQINHWQQQGLRWTALTWHPGTSLINKLKDLLAGWRVLALAASRCSSDHYPWISRGSYGYIYGRSLGMRLFLYQFEPHSEYAIDNGMWPKEAFSTALPLP